MDELRRQVRRARRKLMLEQFLGNAARCLLAAMCAALIAVLVPRLWAIGGDSTLWSLLWVGGLLALGLAAAAAITWWRPPSELEAAIEIDRRFELKQRVASALELSPKERESQFGRALIEDAARRVSRVDMRQRFRPRADRRGLLPLAPLALALAVALLWPAAEPAGAIGKTVATQAAQQQIQNTARRLEKQVSVGRKKAEQKNLKEAGELFRRLQQGLRRLEEKSAGDRRKALAELNKVAREIEQRSEKVRGAEQLKRQLKGLDTKTRGPGDKLNDALSKGDFQAAAQEAQRLKRELEKKGLSKEDREKLSKQLRKMQQQLSDMAQQHAQAQKQLEQEIERLQSQGEQEKAADLQNQLERLEKMQRQMAAAERLSEKLAQAADKLGQELSEEAAAKLAEAGLELRQLSLDAEELELLEEALDRIAEGKAAMLCDKCQGKGCQQCEEGAAAVLLARQGSGNPGDKQGSSGQGGGKEGKTTGPGSGAGQGQGYRPESQGDFKTENVRVEAKPKRGAATIVGQADGPNLAGKARAEIAAEISSARQASDDPLPAQPLSKSEKEQVRQYFDAFRGRD